MLFSPVSLLAALSLVTSVVSAPTLNLDSAVALSKRASDAETATAFNDLASQIKSKKSELDAALEEVDTGDASAVAVVAKPILQDVDADIKALHSSLGLQKRDIVLLYRQNDNSTDPDALIDLIQPLQDLIAENPVLGALLSPLLSNLTIDLVYVLTGLGLVLTGVLSLVGNLLSGLLGGLGLGGLLSSLGL
ncbi:hypothetical protein JCM6882_008633 [Rhodosporidiobolus microsporus]